MANILVVDDEPKMTSLVCGCLEDEGHKVTTTIKPEEALLLIEKHSFDIVITDLSMPKISGMEVLEKALEKNGTQVIMMTAYGSVETAVEAMKKGAVDYLLKPFSLEELELLVQKLVSQQKVTALNKHYQQEDKGRASAAFIGDSPAARKVKQLISKVAGTDATVLLTGRSGTGKEVAARIVHALSPRADKPFIAINCAALTETLLESELFGHEKGAFTGATARKIGRFELADQGSLFLDEIGELSPGLQSKLLRVLEEGELIRVGGVDQVPIDVRIIAATNKILKEEIKTGAFREDLFFRLSVFPIELPNLSDRREDIISLAEFFLAQGSYKHRTISSDVGKLLMSYDWPGNIRELRNVMERAMILAAGEMLTCEDFSLEVDSRPIAVESNPFTPEEGGLEAAEKQMILKALDRANGNKTEAASALQISRRRLYSRMKYHNIDV